jgi:hypothetical protein
MYGENNIKFILLFLLTLTQIYTVDPKIVYKLLPFYLIT